MRSVWLLAFVLEVCPLKANATQRPSANRNVDSGHSHADQRSSFVSSKITMKIDAAKYWNHTGMLLESGASYDLIATGTWIDAGRSCGPDGYPKGNLFQDLFKCVRRSPAVQWFTLMGSVGCNRDTNFAIGSHLTYVAPRTGELVCFANDVPGFYWNNGGFVTLEVRRIR